jgi:hypothetical protein
MSEVYTISGSGFGQPTPEQFAMLEQKNAQVIQRQVARSKAPPAALLQNALKALGTSRGDPALSKLKVDGIIGPATVKAVNLAFANYLGPLPAPLAITAVRKQADQLAQQITSYVEAHGGTVPPPWVGSKKRSTFIPPPPSVMPAMTATTPGDNKWVWYVVGGVSILLVLGIVARSVRRPPPQPVKA